MMKKENKDILNHKKDTKKISAEYFYYPSKGIKQLLDNLVKEIKKNKTKIITGKSISEISTKNNKIDSVKIENKKIKTDFLISTIYLDNLTNLIKNSSSDTKQSSSI